MSEPLQPSPCARCRKLPDSWRSEIGATRYYLGCGPCKRFGPRCLSRLESVQEWNAEQRAFGLTVPGDLK